MTKIFFGGRDFLKANEAFTYSNIHNNVLALIVKPKGYITFHNTVHIFKIFQYFLAQWNMSWHFLVKLWERKSTKFTEMKEITQNKMKCLCINAHRAMYVMVGYMPVWCLPQLQTRTVNILFLVESLPDIPIMSWFTTTG